MAYCPKCNAELTAGAAFCGSCAAQLDQSLGESLQTPAEPAVVAVSSHTDPSHDAISTFVGKNYAYYEKKWSVAQGKQTPATFSPAAFFLGLIWMVYRKMYLCAAILFAIIVAEGVFEEIVGLPESLSRIITYAFPVATGLLGNYLYKLHVDKKVKDIVSLGDPDRVHAELVRQGGTNLGAALSVLFILMVLIGWLVISSSQSSY